MSLRHAPVSLGSSPALGEDHNISRLLEMLGKLADPRSPQRKRHKSGIHSACAVVAMLAGACNYRQLGSQAADLPQSLLTKLGTKWNWFRRRYDWSSESTLRRVLRSIDASALDLLTRS